MADAFRANWTLGKDGSGPGTSRVMVSKPIRDTSSFLVSSSSSSFYRAFGPVHIWPPPNADTLAPEVGMVLVKHKVSRPIVDQ